MHGGQDKIKPEFWWGNLMEGDHLKDLSMGEMIILK
jgi:hypothetical protein